MNIQNHNFEEHQRSSEIAKLVDSGLFEDRAGIVVVSEEGIRLLKAQAHWMEQADSPAPDHRETRFIYGCGFSAALASICHVLKGHGLEELGGYFSNDVHVGVSSVEGCDQFIAQIFLSALGLFDRAGTQSGGEYGV